MSRCDSAAIVPNTTGLLPEPETPVKTVSRRFGISTLTSLRLFTRAPSTRIRSWLSAGGDDVVSVVVADVMAVLIGSPSVGRTAASLSTSSATSDETRNDGQDQRGGLEYPCGGPCAGTHRNPGQSHGSAHEPPPVACCTKVCPQPRRAQGTGVPRTCSNGVTAAPRLSRRRAGSASRRVRPCPPGCPPAPGRRPTARRPR